MGATDALKLPIPELTDTADGPDAISDLANAVEDYVYDRVLPSGVTRYPLHFWGSGTALPTSVSGAKAGDTYYHTGLACTMRCISPGATAATNIWRQAEVAIVANLATRDAMSANYSAILHDGFEVEVLAVTGPPALPAAKYRWQTNSWVIPNTGLPLAVLRQTIQSGSYPAGWGAIALDLAQLDTHGGWASGANTRWTCPAGHGGTFKASGHTVLSTYGDQGNVAIWKNGAALPDSTGTWSTGQSFVTGEKIFTLSPGDYISLMGYRAVTWGTSVFPDAASSLTIERIR